MAWEVPVKLEDAVYAATRAALGEAALATPALTRAIVDRSQRYTSDRQRLAQPTDRAADLAARAAFFTIADAMKIAIPIGELVQRGALPARRPLRVLDVGAGCGAMTLGLVASLAPSIALEVVAIDHDAAALGIAKAAIQAFTTGREATVTLVTQSADALRAELPPADLVVLGTVLNELAAADALALVERALGAISDDGAVIVIEPALRDTSRALHAVRDAVITRGTGHVFAPCTRRGAPCPALADPNDWCHEDRALQLSPRTAELARLTHLRDGGMKLAYLTLRKQPLDLVDALVEGLVDPSSVTAWRIVSAPMPAKGKLEIFGCSAHGRIPLRLLRRHRNPGNRDLERVDRGDVVVITDATPDAERVEIRSASNVTRR
ncbi:MAG: Ribosomal small subunit Rsm22 [Deltaproteobacteria bacterium]|nr:Ribosomal small subunit Rsm22 [Deltaproteobacteria bacterium]